MRKHLLLIVVVFAAGVFFLHTTTSSVEADTAIVDLCLSTASAPGGCVFVCPGGDGQTLAARGTVIDVTILGDNGDPIPNIQASDFWFVGCDGNMSLCGGSACINADGPTDSNGHTTISGTIGAGGYAEGVNVVVMGIVIGCPEPTCLPITVRSPDMDANLVIDIVDLALFAPHYTSPPKPYNTQADFNCDGYVDILDLAMFAFHYGPPAHLC